MKKLSTGEDSTLGTYKKWAEFFGPKAEQFIQKKIDEAPLGEAEEVLANEGQMLMVFAELVD